MKAYDNLGLTLDALGQPDAAQKAFQKAIELNERYHLKSAWPYENLGELLLKQNEVAESISYFEKALLINPGWPKGHVSLGKAQLGLARLKKPKRTSWQRFKQILSMEMRITNWGNFIES